MLDYELLLRPLAALLAGALVGLERSYHGRAAGLRTYALVCLGSALLVALAEELSRGPAGGLGDSTRVIQGIVTGIGFLGAGVIVKEGFSVRGLTTAASVWVISAVGVVLGAGFYVLGAVATALTLALLSVLRIRGGSAPFTILRPLPSFFPPRPDQRRGLAAQACCRAWFFDHRSSYRLDSRTESFEYKFVMWSAETDACGRLARTLLALPKVVDFRISPSRD